jgi:hypothetical protein
MADKGLSEAFVNKYAEKCPLRDVDTMIWLKIKSPELVKTAKLQTLEDVEKAMGKIFKKHENDNFYDSTVIHKTEVKDIIKNIREAL